MRFICVSQSNYKASVKNFDAFPLHSVRNSITLLTHKWNASFILSWSSYNLKIAKAEEIKGTILFVTNKFMPQRRACFIKSCTLHVAIVCAP